MPVSSNGVSDVEFQRVRFTSRSFRRGVSGNEFQAAVFQVCAMKPRPGPHAYARQSRKITENEENSPGNGIMHGGEFQGVGVSGNSCFTGVVSGREFQGASFRGRVSRA